MPLAEFFSHLRSNISSKAGKELISKLIIPTVLFFSVMLLGIIGYMVIEGYTLLESVYITSITVSTVGFGEVRPLTDAGRVFTIFLILTNVVVFTYVVALFSQYLADGRYIKNYKILKMENKVSYLRDHVIVCGYGRNGRQATQILADNNISFVLIEKDDYDNREKPDVKYMINGDATQDDVLLTAGIQHAKAIVTTLPHDTDNLFVVLTAKQLNPKIKIVSRASNDTTVKKLKIAGANNVIMPDKIGGAHMASLILIPDVVEVLSLLSTRNNSEFKVVEVSVGRSISMGEADLWRKTGCTILAIKSITGEYALNPGVQNSVQPGESIILMGSELQIESARKIIS